MTYRNDFTLPAEMLEQIASQGFDVLPDLIRTVVNAAMRAERAAQQYNKHAKDFSYPYSVGLSVTHPEQDVPVPNH
jgi:hypothetical protein